MKSHYYRNYKKLEKLTFWLENCIPIPFTRWTIGLDGFIGLIPVVGDITMLVFTGFLFVQAVRQKASSHLMGLMFKNVLIDFVVGLIPVVGDIFDMAWKANSRNLKLLLDHAKQVSTEEGT